MLFTYDGNMCFHVQSFEKGGYEIIDMSATEKHQEFVVHEVKKEFVVHEVKKIRGRPRKNPLEIKTKKTKGVLRQGYFCPRIYTRHKM